MNLNKLDSFRINYNYVRKKYFIIKIINLKRNLFYVEFSINVLDILSIGIYLNCLCIFFDLENYLEIGDMKCYKNLLDVLNGFIGRVRIGYIVIG